MTYLLIISGLLLLITGVILFKAMAQKPPQPSTANPEDIKLSGEVLFRVGPALLKGKIMYLNRVEECAFIRQCSPSKEMYSVEFHQIIEIL